MAGKLAQIKAVLASTIAQTEKAKQSCSFSTKLSSRV